MFLFYFSVCWDIYTLHDDITRVLTEIIIFLFSLIILLFPILFWMYIFTSFEHLWVSRLQFIIGMWAWVIATLPLIFEDLFVIWGLVEEIFFSFSFIGTSFLGWVLFMKLALFFAFIFGIFFLINYIFSQENIYKFKPSLWGFWLLLFLFSFIIFAIYKLGENVALSESIHSGSFVFSWLWAIVWYYLIISLLEEGMKYFSSLNISWERKTLSFEKMLVCSAVIALGFSFFENILYAYSYMKHNWVDGGLLHIVFFRSLFTISLHVLSSMILAAWFYMIIMLSGKYNKTRIMFLSFASLGIISHALFDVAITFGYIGVVFLYIFFLYILVGYITSPAQ